MSQAQQNQMSIRVELAGRLLCRNLGPLHGAERACSNAVISKRRSMRPQQIGDDTIQRRTQGYVVPESFNHGTSAQRQDLVRPRFRQRPAGSLRHLQQSGMKSRIRIVAGNYFRCCLTVG
jgi:predicted metalloprotease